MNFSSSQKEKKHNYSTENHNTFLLFISAILHSGNIYLTGETDCNLGENINQGNYDIFFAKYDINGVKKFTKQFGSSMIDYPFEINIDMFNYIYITGYTKGSLDGNIYSGNEDIFVSKFTQSGDKIWSKQFGTSLFDSGNAIAIGNNNSIYITGTTSGQLDWNFGFGQNDIFFTTIENQ